MLNMLKYLFFGVFAVIVLTGAKWPVSLLHGKWIMDEKKMGSSDFMYFDKDGTFLVVLENKPVNDTIQGTYDLKNDTLVIVPFKLPGGEEPDTIKNRILSLDAKRLSLINDGEDTVFLIRE
jgi:hypothetical protein